MKIEEARKIIEARARVLNHYPLWVDVAFVITVQLLILFIYGLLKHYE